MEEKRVTKLREAPGLRKEAARWFSEKWDIPPQAYEESMEECEEKGIPQWYVILSKQGKIIAGAGVIENDFHERKDLTPNLCALFVEEAYRRQGMARHLLEFIRRDLAAFGIETVYLVTDHEAFYEKCGWGFLTAVRDDEGAWERLYVSPKGEKQESKA